MGTSFSDDAWLLSPHFATILFTTILNRVFPLQDAPDPRRLLLDGGGIFASVIGSYWSPAVELESVAGLLRKRPALIVSERWWRRNCAHASRGSTVYTRAMKRWNSDM